MAKTARQRRQITDRHAAEVQHIAPWIRQILRRQVCVLHVLMQVADFIVQPDLAPPGTADNVTRCPLDRERRDVSAGSHGILRQRLANPTAQGVLERFVFQLAAHQFNVGIGLEYLQRTNECLALVLRVLRIKTFYAADLKCTAPGICASATQGITHAPTGQSHGGFKPRLDGLQPQCTAGFVRVVMGVGGQLISHHRITFHEIKSPLGLRGAQKRPGLSAAQQRLLACTHILLALGRFQEQRPDQAKGWGGVFGIEIAPFQRTRHVERVAIEPQLFGQSQRNLLEAVQHADFTDAGVSQHFAHHTGGQRGVVPMKCLHGPASEYFACLVPLTEQGLFLGQGETGDLVEQRVGTLLRGDRFSSKKCRGQGVIHGRRQGAEYPLLLHISHVHAQGRAPFTSQRHIQNNASICTQNL